MYVSKTLKILKFKDNTNIIKSPEDGNNGYIYCVTEIVKKNLISRDISIL